MNFPGGNFHGGDDGSMNFQQPQHRQFPDRLPTGGVGRGYGMNQQGFMMSPQLLQQRQQQQGMSMMIQTREQQQMGMMPNVMTSSQGGRSRGRNKAGRMQQQIQQPQFMQNNFQGVGQYQGGFDAGVGNTAGLAMIGQMQQRRKKTQVSALFNLFINELIHSLRVNIFRIPCSNNINNINSNSLGSHRLEWDFSSNR